jgi:gamma-D-glutamyl-L-lysine dipeptidyl-peptidase
VAAAELTDATARVAMVWPHRAVIRRAAADLRAMPQHDSELVDQAHWGEHVRVLGARDAWRYVQGEDLYFGWCPRTDLYQFTKYGRNAVVAVVAAPVRERPAPAAPVMAELPCGALIPETRLSTATGGGLVPPTAQLGGWLEVAIVGDRGERTGFVSGEHVAALVDLPHRYPTPDDLLATAGAFLGVRYLWGGTTAHGMDCSGFVQQVYRLNGVGLPRDADQQAMLGRLVDEARPGDLYFFGAEAVTHVAIATTASEFLHAPVKGGVIERGQLGGDRRLRAIRRYLPELPEMRAA